MRDWRFLEVIQPSRKRVRPGDIFAMLPPDGRYLFGRVISTEAHAFSFDRLILLYVYDFRSESMLPPSDEILSPERLLIPPELTDRLAWSKGYFVTVENRPLEDADRLTVHCFRSLNDGRYYDENNNRLPGPIEPVGIQGMTTVGGIEKEIAEALGIPILLEDD